MSFFSTTVFKDDGAMHTSRQLRSNYIDKTTRQSNKFFDNYHQEVKHATGLWNTTTDKPNYKGFKVYPLEWWLPSLIHRLGIVLGFLDKDAYYSKLKNQVIAKLEAAHHKATNSFEEKRIYMLQMR